MMTMMVMMMMTMMMMETTMLNYVSAFPGPGGTAGHQMCPLSLHLQVPSVIILAINLIVIIVIIIIIIVIFNLNHQYNEFCLQRCLGQCHLIVAIQL